jgi:hypothetical protein
VCARERGSTNHIAYLVPLPSTTFLPRLTSRLRPSCLTPAESPRPMVDFKNPPLVDHFGPVKYNQTSRQNPKIHQRNPILSITLYFSPLLCKLRTVLMTPIPQDPPPHRDLRSSVHTSPHEAMTRFTYTYTYTFIATHPDSDTGYPSGVTI